MSMGLHDERWHLWSPVHVFHLVTMLNNTPPPPATTTQCSYPVVVHTLVHGPHDPSVVNTKRGTWRTPPTLFVPQRSNTLGTVVSHHNT